MTIRKAILLAIPTIAVLCSTGSAQTAGVVVVTPAADRAYLVTDPQTIDKIADLEEVFSGQDHSYGVSVTPEGIFDVLVGTNGEVDLQTDATVFGTATVTVTAKDANGGFASDSFKVTLRPVQLFVDANTPAATADQDGATWATAYQHLQDALSVVVEDQEIWVAKGAYYPDVDAAGDSDLRSRSFRMVKKIPVYGGFAGGETGRDERDAHGNLTILSGDIHQDDLQQPIATHVKAQGGDENNSYRVVDLSECDHDDILDGFVITAGRADFAPANLVGAGVFTVKDVRIENCRITGNYAVNGGAGLYISDDKPMIVRCQVSGNRTEDAGGGIYARKGDARLFNCEIRGNQALVGGGLYLEEPDLDMVNCLIAGNCGLLSGGGIQIQDGKLTAANCTVSGNSTEGTGGALMVVKGGHSKIRNSIIYGNQAEGSTTGANASVCFLDDGDAPKFRSSLVENSGGSGDWNGTAGIDEEGNLDLNPLFVMPCSPSLQPSQRGVFCLRSDSPALDAGLVEFILKDKADLDRDDNDKELISLDLVGEERVLEVEIDLGAYEFNPAAMLDSDGDGLSDNFELRHVGDPVALPALSDQDGDCSVALGEFVHGKNPTVGGELAPTVLGITEHLGEKYLTLTFTVDPEALNFATYTVLRRGGPWLPSVPWVEGQTVEISSVPSPSNPEMMEITHRSLFPIGSVVTEFLRVRHQPVAAGL